MSFKLTCGMYLLLLFISFHVESVICVLATQADGCRLLCATITSGQLESGTHTVNISTHNVSSVQPPLSHGISPSGSGLSTSSTATFEKFNVVQIFGKHQTARESY